MRFGIFGCFFRFVWTFIDTLEERPPLNISHHLLERLSASCYDMGHVSFVQVPYLYSHSTFRLRFRLVSFSFRFAPAWPNKKSPAAFFQNPQGYASGEKCRSVDRAFFSQGPSRRRSFIFVFGLPVPLLLIFVSGTFQERPSWA